MHEPREPIPQSNDRARRARRDSEGRAARNKEASMIGAKQLLIVGASVLASAFSGIASSQETEAQYVQIAHIEVDPAQLESYRSAVREQVEAAIRLEPGVLVLYSVTDNDNPTHVTVFEIYKDIAAYKFHLQSAHFKKYKAVTEKMVKSLTLAPSTPIMLGAKGR
jgi:quinol monooxygenase YgiN